MSDVELTDLACDFPTVPINNTHCEDYTYGEYMDTKGPSLLVSRIFFFCYPGAAMVTFLYRAYWNKNISARVNLFMFAFMAFGLFCNGIDPASKLMTV